MAKNYSIPEAVSLFKQFRENPTDKNLQMEITDLGRRNPLFLTCIAAEMYEYLLSRTPDYYTSRKANDACRDYTPAEFRAFLGESGKGESEDGSSELDTVDEETKEPVAVGSKNKKQEQPAVNLAALLSDDDEI